MSALFAGALVFGIGADDRQLPTKIGGESRQVAGTLDYIPAARTEIFSHCGNSVPALATPRRSGAELTSASKRGRAINRARATRCIVAPAGVTAYRGGSG
jgi:hypothetical protein